MGSRNGENPCAARAFFRFNGLGGRPGGLEHLQGNQSVALANGAIPAVENIDEKTGLANHPPPGPIGNPGALAGATGAVFETSKVQSSSYRVRADAATALCHAIADCHPDDAVTILAAALDDLRPGQPVAAFRSMMIEADSWAAFATRNELKCYSLAAFAAMRPADQEAFLAFVQRGAAA